MYYAVGITASYSIEGEQHVIVACLIEEAEHHSIAEKQAIARFRKENKLSIEIEVFAAVTHINIHAHLNTVECQTSFVNEGDERGFYMSSAGPLDWKESQKRTA